MRNEEIPGRSSNNYKVSGADVGSVYWRDLKGTYVSGLQSEKSTEKNM